MIPWKKMINQKTTGAVFLFSLLYCWHTINHFQNNKLSRAQSRRKTVFAFLVCQKTRDRCQNKINIGFRENSRDSFHPTPTKHHDISHIRELIRTQFFIASVQHTLQRLNRYRIPLIPPSMAFAHNVIEHSPSNI